MKMKILMVMMKMHVMMMLIAIIAGIDYNTGVGDY